MAKFLNETIKVHTYIWSTEAELLLIETKSVVKSLHTEVQQIRSSGHHGYNSLRAELLWLEIVYSLQARKEREYVLINKCKNNVKTSLTAAATKRVNDACPVSTHGYITWLVNQNEEIKHFSEISPGHLAWRFSKFSVRMKGLCEMI